MKRHMTESLVIGVFFTAVSYILGVGLGWIQTPNWLEVFAVFTSYVCTWLCVRERRINYPIGAVSSVAYAVLFWQTGLLASATLNAYLVFQLVYGWFRWRSDANARPVTFVSVRAWPVYLLATAAAYSVAVWIWSLTHTVPVWTDIFILVGTILAQFLLDNKKIENWGIWFVVDVVAVWTYYHQGLPLVGFQYVLFLVNTVIGFFVWRRSQKDHEWSLIKKRRRTLGEVFNAKSVRAGNSYAADHGSSASDPVR